MTGGEIAELEIGKRFLIQKDVVINPLGNVEGCGQVIITAEHPYLITSSLIVSQRARPEKA